MDTALDSRPAIALSWAMIAVMALITLASLAWLGVSAPASSLPVGVVALVATLLAFHLRLNRIPRILIGTAAFLQFCLILPIGMLLSFAAAASDAPFRDGLLLAADRAVGFDWMAYAQWVDSRPWVAIAYRAAYLSFMMQPPLLIALLAWHGEFRRLHLFSFAFTFTLTVTCLIFYFVPAVSIYAHLQVPPEGFRNLHPVSTFQHLEFIEGMRAGTMPWIDPLKGAGLITFPSFHACGAVLLAWGFWGVRAARAPALLLNLTMLASTPLDGAHYLVDVIGGMLLAAAGIAVARTLERRLGPGLAQGVARACAPLAAHPAFARRPNPTAAG
ncbi:MAG TPA: phosphatase PAP2 family protein [Allosphingosinicella sp.]|jgi:hypothetical protein